MIIFVGCLIGAGKSSVAQGLAQNLSLYYYDVDKHKREIYSQDPDFEYHVAWGTVSPFARRPACA